ncbi:gamma-glutamylcyclotransferase family protein [Sphingomonas bacterium]|uniref:gamma-glutamylcyclotransferase family protein n=1 Tax=Sphingomonas bacterium TaxID=1895847 RepID=UPI00261DF84D|nr:gamma-glutamylcyclotransferase family protein [Sphingomonas bacterium]MDB5679553.1 UDP-N-acetylmuramate--alanine ligase [Sphingomonas bacterium]
MSDEPSFLFSYGSLRRRDVQLAVFGHELEGFDDVLPGFAAVPIRLTDPRTIATGGTADHLILRATADGSGAVPGLALAIRPEDVPVADAYEPAGYERTAVNLASGRRAFVYVAGAGS